MICHVTCDTDPDDPSQKIVQIKSVNREFPEFVIESKQARGMILRLVGKLFDFESERGPQS